MDENKFIKVATYANATDAEHIRNVLEANGISAFIDAAATNTALSYVGTALGGVRVFVRADDVQHAIEVIASDDDASNSGRAPWFCGSCEEEIEGSFDICWSCGEPREQVARPLPNSRKIDHFKAGIAVDGTANAPTSFRRDLDSTNPYAALTATEVARTQHDQPVAISQEAEDMLLRAWRASIIGIGLFPLILHFYSMYLLIRATMIAKDFSPDGNKRFYRAFVVNVIFGCVWTAFLRFMLSFR